MPSRKLKRNPLIGNNRAVLVEWKDTFTRRGFKSRMKIVEDTPSKPDPKRTSRRRVDDVKEDLQEESNLLFDDSPIPALNIPKKYVSPYPLIFKEKFQIKSIYVQTQNNYMREWLNKRNTYLHHLLASEAPVDNRTCHKCKGDGSWRCLDCLGRPQFCVGCCRQAHTSLPFHRVQQWQGDFYQDSWLSQCGIKIHLGHGGQPCSSENNNPFLDDCLDDDIYDSDAQGDEKVDEEDFTYFSFPSSQQGGSGSGATTMMSIVDRTGVHQLEVHWCRCANAAQDDIQLLEMGFFPSSYKRIRTVFTFHVLDEYLLDNLECKTSAMHFYEKIRRLTCSAFPHTVPVSGLATLKMIVPNVDICYLGSLSRVDAGVPAMA